MTYVTWRPIRDGEHEAVDVDTGEYLNTVYRDAAGRWRIADDGGEVTEGGEPVRHRSLKLAKQAVEAAWSGGEWDDTEEDA